MIDDILEFNKKFVESKGYEKYITNKSVSYTHLTLPTICSV